MHTSPTTSPAVSQHSPDTSGDPPQPWQQVDEGWGRRAVDFATLSEPANCREYVTLHHHLGVKPSDRLLDVACGAGLAVELATAVGAACSGIDASPRLIAVARDRNPHADLRVGDMQDLPWSDASFDVVTSCRGIWSTTAGAVPEAHRVLVPGGRLGITVWVTSSGPQGHGRWRRRRWRARRRLNTRRRWWRWAGQGRARSC